MKFFIYTHCNTSIVINLQEVALKRFMKQDISGDALAQFRCEVSEIFQACISCMTFYMLERNFSIIYWSCICLLFDLDRDYVEVATSKYCSFHGSCITAPKYVYIDGISPKVNISLANGNTFCDIFRLILTFWKWCSSNNLFSSWLFAEVACISCCTVQISKLMKKGE